jgi:hypothetical protein
MAKKKKQSLSERIAALINRVGEKPEPTFGDIKSELVECLSLAETLENGAVIRNSEAKVKVLEAENSNLQAELQSLKTEVDGFRAERKKQEEKERQKDIPDIQLHILRGLPTEHIGDGATLEGFVAEPTFHRTKPQFILTGWRKPDSLNAEVTKRPSGL